VLNHEEFGQGRSRRRLQTAGKLAAFSLLALLLLSGAFCLWLLFATWLTTIELPRREPAPKAVSSLYILFHAHPQGGTMADKAANGDWIDATGKQVPLAYVPAIPRKRDELVEKHFKTVLGLHEKMIAAKAALDKGINEYVAFLRQQEGLKGEGWKGNLELTNFSGNRQIEVSINEVIEFDERLKLAKERIDICLKKWSKDGNDRLRVIVTEAFNVEKKGKVNTKQLLRLLTLNLNDSEWEAAMDLVRESINVAGTRRYIKLNRRPNRDAKWESLNLNFSTL
jgi:hypothetical protein